MFYFNNNNNNNNNNKLFTIRWPKPDHKIQKKKKKTKKSKICMGNSSWQGPRQPLTELRQGNAFG